MDVRSKVQELVKESECVELLKRWVAVNTENPPGLENPLAEIIHRQLSDWGFNSELFETLPNRLDVIATVPGSQGNPRLMFNGHMDVVPAGERSHWTVTGPYDPIVKDGKLYGRGSCDQKGGLVAQTIAAKALKDAGVKLKGDLILTYVIGEEMGEPGSKYLFTKKQIKADWGVVTEPTGTNEGLRVAVAQCGLVWIHIAVRGQSTHASTPHAGINAISKATRVVQALEKYHQGLSSRKHPLIAPPRCTVTNLHGGIKENVIPDLCKITIDRRMIPGENVKQVVGEVTEILEGLKKSDPDFRYTLKYGSESYDTEGTGVYEPSESPESSKLCQTMLRNQKEVMRIAPPVWGTPYSSDMRNLVHDGKIETVTFGPGMVEWCHRPDEFVAMQEVVEVARVLALTAIDLLG